MLGLLATRVGRQSSSRSRRAARAHRRDFNADSVSCYTYVSVVGSGHVLSLVAAFVQILLPVVLVSATLQSVDVVSLVDDEGHEREHGPRGCLGTGKTINKLTILSVLLIYLTTIVPTQLQQFLGVTSDMDSARAKLSSLRRVIAHEGKDSNSQAVGYTLDRFFNTAFVAVLYSINIVMIFYTPSVTDIVLNALAIE